LLIFFLYFSPGQFSSSMKAMDLKHHRMIDLIDKKCSAQSSIDKKCSAQKLLLCTYYFFSYGPISFLSWPFLLNYIVHKATHPTRGVLVWFFLGESTTICKFQGIGNQKCFYFTVFHIPNFIDNNLKIGIYLS
jgi:hypothetical protein